MKLLMVSGDRSVAAGKRGALWYTLEEFAKHWDRIDIVCPRAVPATGSPDFRSREMMTVQSRYPRNVFFHPSPHGLWYQPRWIVRRGQELIAEHRHDVMTVHEYPPFYNGRGAIRLHRRTGIPFAFEIHHVVGHPRASTVLELLGRCASRVMLPREARTAAAVRVVSSIVAHVLTQWGIPERKIHNVPSCYLDHTALQPDPTIAKCYDIVCCGRLVPNKGFTDVLHAVAKLPHISLCIIGDGPMRPAFEKAAIALGIRDRVTFVGWMPDQAETYRAMQGGRIFVMNSQSEGGPRVALEAMALGLPLIATRVGLMPEVIHDGENGLFTIGDPADLAQKFRLLLGDSELRNRIGTAARSVLNRFERRALIRNYAIFLQSLISSPFQ